MKKVWPRILIWSLPILLAALLAAKNFGPSSWAPIAQFVRGSETVGSVIAEIGPQHRKAWEEILSQTGSDYPPKSISLVVLKEEKVMEIWTGETTQGRAL